MKNNQLLPFERNRYYPGKMLTSSDFKAEQTYLNNKRRFLTNMMFGPGIVCGCGVYSLDDLSILVESGMAIDDYGREIVIDASVVKKLSGVEGFQSLETSSAFLCLRYREEDIHPVYSVNHPENGPEYEYNRIGEGYELFLMDTSAQDCVFQEEEEFFSRHMLYEDQDFEVEFVIPASICSGYYVKAAVLVRKKSSELLSFSYSGTLQMPEFTAADGGHELEISVDNVKLGRGEAVAEEYWMKAPDTPAERTEFVMKAGTGQAVSAGVELKAGKIPVIGVSVVDMHPEELTAAALGKVSLELRNAAGRRDYINLARLDLVRTDSAYIIDSVEERGVRNYIAIPAQYKERSACLSCFSKRSPDWREQSRRSEDDTGKGKNHACEEKPTTAAGTLEIPLGDKVKKGDVRYSGEVIHGLGKGNVYVQVGYEYYEKDRAMGANIKSTVYGRPELFGEETGFRGVETAVKVLNDKGSFIVAARFMKDVEYLVLTCRWVAVRFPGGEDMGTKTGYEDRSITADTPTVALGVKESYYFHVRFHNMETCSIAYELTEAGSGEITSDGIYTAPMKEGVYEIRIYCTDMPVICTYAYAIVRKKEMEKDGS